ncbi:P2Y purinoceptor 8-like [Hydractinia symbiolongicarpus]|uniref:P2Y purinoceptor 8-like n=1 Tax=Hydractinia symbiolongicarpus TaxID=13093 RepID=UPI00254B854F|nr:P2Y purinoceptor 8-like [Hydractinia symbiolongicarpus]
MATNNTTLPYKWPAHVFTVEASIIITINGVLVVFIVSRKVLRSNPSTIFFLNLLISHVAEGIAAMWFEHNLTRENFVAQGRSENALIKVFTASLLLGCLSYIPYTADRLVAIRWPLFYQTLTKKKVILICIQPWLFSLFFLLTLQLFHFPKETGDVVAIILVSIMSLVLIISNTIIYRVVLKHVKEIKKTTVGVENIDKTDREKIKSRHEKIEKRRMRSVYICSGIVVSYIVCWAPHMIHDIIKMTNIDSTIVGARSHWPKITLVVAFLNPIIDPLIWISLNRRIKKEIKSCFYNSTFVS